MRSYPLRQEYLVSYDVEDNKVRGRVFKELGKHGLKPVQKSVFWGFLTVAELGAIKRYLHESLEKTDKAFVTRANFNGRGRSYFVGHQRHDFSDWKETDVI